MVRFVLFGKKNICVKRGGIAASLEDSLLATAFLLHRPQNRYRFGDDLGVGAIIRGGIGGD